MPKPRITPLAAKINAIADVKGYTDAEIMRAAQIKSRSTYSERKKDSGQFRVEELQSIAKTLGAKFILEINEKGELIVGD